MRIFIDSRFCFIRLFVRLLCVRFTLAGTWETSQMISGNMKISSSFCFSGNKTFMEYSYSFYQRISNNLNLSCISKQSIYQHYSIENYSILAFFIIICICNIFFKSIYQYYWIENYDILVSFINEFIIIWIVRFKSVDLSVLLDRKLLNKSVSTLNFEVVSGLIELQAFQNHLKLFESLPGSPLKTRHTFFANETFHPMRRIESSIQLPQQSISPRSNFRLSWFPGSSSKNKVFEVLPRCSLISQRVAKLQPRKSFIQGLYLCPEWNCLLHVSATHASINMTDQTRTFFFNLRSSLNYIIRLSTWTFFREVNDVASFVNSFKFLSNSFRGIFIFEEYSSFRRSNGANTKERLFEIVFADGGL